MYGERSLNITSQRAGITTSWRRPVDYPAYGRGLNQPESAAMGGSEFQHHRSNYAPTYVADAIPTETGYASIGYEPVAVCGILGGFGRLAYVNGCCMTVASSVQCSAQLEHEPEFVRYSCRDVRSIAHTHAGEFILAKLPDGGHTLLHYVGGIEVEESVQGLDLTSSNLLGMFSISGRLLMYSDTDVYVSSAENILDFLPSLRTQAQSFTVRFNIGRIVTAIGFGESAYLFGTRGAAKLTCSGDANFPYAARMVSDFTGIEHQLNVQVDYAASEFYVWSRSGLVVIRDTNTLPTQLPDVSEALAEQRVVYLAGDVTPDGVKLLSHTDDLQTICYDTRDDLTCDEPSTLVKELVVDRGVVAVREHNQRLVTVSYGTDADATYTRLLLVDKVLGRITVLHTPHTDVIADRRQLGMGYASLVLARPSGECERLIHGQGVARVYYGQLTGTNRKAVKLVGHTLKGDFNTAAYPDVEKLATSLACGATRQSESSTIEAGNLSSLLSRVHCIAGQDIPGRNQLHNLRLVTKTRGDLHYVGRSIGHTVSTLTAFSGRLTELILRRTQ